MNQTVVVLTQSVRLLHCDAKKLHHFIFAITLSPLKGVFILPCEMQHTCMCYDQRRFYHVSLNVTSLEHLNET